MRILIAPKVCSYHRRGFDFPDNERAALLSLLWGGCVAKFSEIRDNARFLAIKKPMISFKGAHFPKCAL
jgi:hypothetical protein